MCCHTQASKPLQKSGRCNQVCPDVTHCGPAARKDDAAQHRGRALAERELLNVDLWAQGHSGLMPASFTSLRFR
jgi:hypothetical protein